MDTEVSLVNQCSSANKCEYQCRSGYELVNGNCQELPPEADIHASKVRAFGPRANIFSLASDTIYFRVRNAGANALGCAAYEAADGSRGNISSGHCTQDDDFVPMITNDEWTYNPNTNVYRLDHRLRGGYHIPGTFVIYFKNPDTNSVNVFQYTVNP